jgi:hypothetical protein
MRAGAQRVSAGEAFGSLGRPLGDAVREAEALRMLLGVGALVMSQFPSTVKEDLDILSSGEYSNDAARADSSHLREKKTFFPFCLFVMWNGTSNPARLAL